MGVLSNLADQLAGGDVSFEVAERRASEAIAGRRHPVHGLVIPPTHVLEREFTEMRGYLASHAPEDPRKWAGSLVLLHAQLSIGLRPAALNLVRSVAVVSRGRAPSGAREIALELVDTVLRLPEVPPGVRVELQTARELFEAS